MPMYDYKCPKCEKEFSAIVEWTKRNDKECIGCGEKPLASIFPIIGGYTMKGNNSASVRPKGAGSAPRKTKH